MTTLSRLRGPTIFEAEVDSTNDVVAARARLGAPEGLIVVAETQTQGRGRQGRTWHSPAGSGLYVSVLFRPPAEAARLLSLAGGVAIGEAVRDSTGLAVELKWPNDLLAPGGKRKLAGILVEGSAEGSRIDYVVFGFGINIRPGAYPADLRNQATSIEEELGRAVDPSMVLEHSIAALDRRYDDLLSGRTAAILARWTELCPRARGAKVQWADGAAARAGITDGIDETGALLVVTPQGRERVISGDVTWL